MFIRENIEEIGELITELNFILGGLNKPEDNSVQPAEKRRRASNAKAHPYGGIQNIPFYAREIILPEISSSEAPKRSLFIDSSDSKIKFKDSSGIVNTLY